jgi:hypothetical protein
MAGRGDRPSTVKVINREFGELKIVKETIRCAAISIVAPQMFAYADPTTKAL